MEIEEIDQNFKNQFKLALINALKSGYSGAEIRKELKKQGYSKPLIEEFLAELGTDPDIIDIVTRQQKIDKLKKTTSDLKTKTIDLTEKIIEGIDEGITRFKKRITEHKIKPIFKLPEIKLPKIKAKLDLKEKILKIEPKKEIETKPEKPKRKLLEKIKAKYAKLKQKKEEASKLEVYNIYYNLIIQKKEELKDKNKNLEKLYKNVKNEKEVNKYIKLQKSRIKFLLSKIKKLRDLEPKQTEIKQFINAQGKLLKEELIDLKHIKNITLAKRRIYIKKEQEAIKHNENSLQNIINRISLKSKKFQQAISKI